MKERDLKTSEKATSLLHDFLPLISSVKSLFHVFLPLISSTTSISMYSIFFLSILSEKAVERQIGMVRAVERQRMWF